MAGNNINTVEVCSDAIWRDAIFLKEPGDDTLANITDWDEQQAKTFATKTVLPQVQANIIFIGMALMTLLVFLLWRLFRRCCMSCCMRESCEKQRAEADPDKVLGGRGFWLLKGFLFLVAVAAFAMLIAGIILAPKKLLVKVWEPVDNFSDYLNTTTFTMENLARGLAGVDPIIANLTNIANKDINLTAVRSDVEVIKATLDLSAASPTLLDSKLADLATSQATASSQVGDLRAQLAPSSALQTNLAALSDSAPAWSNAVQTIHNYSTRLSALNGEFDNLNNTAGPTYNTAALVAAMSAVEVPYWQSTVGKMLAGLDAWSQLQTSRAAEQLATAAITLDGTVADLKLNKVPSASDALSAFMDAWNAVLPAVADLLKRIDYVQANVARLDTKTNDSVNRLRAVHANLTEMQRLQPTALQSNLAILTAELGLGPIASMAARLSSLQAALDAVDATQLSDARAAVEGVKASLDALQPKKAHTQDAIDAYNRDSTATTFAAMKTSAVAASNSWDKSQAAKSAADGAAANSRVAAIQDAMGPGKLGGQLSTLAPEMTAVDAAAGDVQASMDDHLETLESYRGCVRDINAEYASMPSPKSSEVSSVSSTLNRIEELVVKTPRDVRAQVTFANDTVIDAVRQVRKEVVNRLDDFHSDHDDTVKTIDTLRYRATCGLFGLAAFFVVLLVLVVAINCPWGIGCAIFFLLLLAALLFLLAALFASVLVVANEGCYQMEDIILAEVGPDETVLPLLRYYLFGNESVTVESVLKSADVVDISRVRGQVINATNSITTNFSAQFTPLGKLQAVFGDIRVFVNSTLDDINDLLGQAALDEVRPFYVDLKSYVCCDLADYGAKIWVVLTFGAWLMYVSCNMAMAFLSRLDQLPYSGCCGCKPLLKSRIRAKVHPEGPEGGQGDGDDGDKATKAVVLDAPGQQQMPVYGSGDYPPATGVPYATTPIDAYTGAPMPMATYPGGPPVGPYAGQPMAAPYGDEPSVPPLRQEPQLQPPPPQQQQQQQQQQPRDAS